MEILLVAGRQFLFDMAASQIYSIKLLSKLKVLLEVPPAIGAAASGEAPGMPVEASTEENNSKVCYKIYIFVIVVPLYMFVLLDIPIVAFVTFKLFFWIIFFCTKKKLYDQQRWQSE